MPQRWIIGLASGSSADGVDAALMELRGVGLELRLNQLHGLHQAYPPELRDLIRRVAGPGLRRLPMLATVNCWKSSSRDTKTILSRPW